MKLKVTVSTNKIGSKDEQIIEIDDEELEGFDETEREDVIEDFARDAMFNMIEWNYSEVEE